MKVFFSSPERLQNCARHCRGRRENQGPNAIAMAKGILHQLRSFSRHFVQISASKEQAAKGAKESEKLCSKKNKNLLKKGQVGTTTLPQFQNS